MAQCAKCGSKLLPGLTRCLNSDCKASLMKPGVFTELLGWVIAVLSSIPIVVALKTVRQNHYPPAVFAGVVLFVGLFLVILGRSKSSSFEKLVVEEAAPETTNDE